MSPFPLHFAVTDRNLLQLGKTPGKCTWHKVPFPVHRSGMRYWEWTRDPKDALPTRHHPDNFLLKPWAPPSDWATGRNRPRAW